MQEQASFDLVFSSKDVYKIEKLDLNDSNIWLSCLPSTKWKVNENIEEDIYNMQYIIKLLNKFKFNNIILFSTIDVYTDSPLDSNEHYHPNISEFNYGTNRRLFEIMVSQMLTYNNLKIFRLPALFGKHIKKNILFDLLNNNQVHKIKTNSKFQWYDLNDLYKDVQERLLLFPKIFNLFPEPIFTTRILDLFSQYSGIVDNVEKGSFYNFKTAYTDTGFLYDRETSFNKLSKFVCETRGE